MLEQSLKNDLKNALGLLRAPLRLVASLGEGPLAKDMLGFLQDVASTSDKIRVETDGTSPLTPSFQIVRESDGVAVVEFAGFPLGHEFTSFVLALLWSSGHPPKVEAPLIERFRAIDTPMSFKVFMSTECHNCPDVVQGLTLCAVLNPKINVTIVEGGSFPDEVERYEVLSIPKVLRDETVFSSGRLSLEDLLDKMQEGQRPTTHAVVREKPFDVLVLGGGPAGVAAAVYAARKGIAVGLVADRVGGQTNDTLKIENYPSVLETVGPTFAKDLERQARQYNVDLMLRQTAASVSRREIDGLLSVQLTGGHEVATRSLILATGARWRNLGVPGEVEYKNKGVAYCPHCDGPLFKNKRVAVVGGGNSGVEAALDLAGVASEVTLVEFGDRLRADAVLVERVNALKNVKVITSAKTVELTGDGAKLNGLVYEDRTTNERIAVPLEGVFVQIGLVPNTEFLKGFVEMTPSGEISVDPKGKTSQSGVFAAGDCTNVPYKQIVVAAGEGSKAALSAFDHLIRTP